jgi:hypothetical protein
MSLAFREADESAKPKPAASRFDAVAPHQAFRNIRQPRRELPAAPGVSPTAPCNDMFADTHA